MKRTIITYLVLFISLNILAQNGQKIKRKFRSPVWTYHTQNTDILGLSVGLIPGSISETKGTTKTFGTRLEIDPISVLYFLFGDHTDVSTSFEDYNRIMQNNVSQISYGINISTGNYEHIDNYGISITALVQNTRKNYGISIAGWSNQIEKSNGIIVGIGNTVFISNGISIGLSGANAVIANGIQIGGMVNEVNFLRGLQIGFSNQIFENGQGLQIGVFNKSKNFKGIQLGLWNTNDKRSLPILNWNFKS